MQITELKGVGDKTKALLNKLKIETVEDLLLHYPHRYEQYQTPVPIVQLQPGKRAIRCFVTENVRAGNNKSMSLRVHDHTGSIILRWFHNPYVGKMLKRGMEYVFYGTVDVYNGYLYFSQPEFCLADTYIVKIGSLMPVYRLTNGLKNESLFKLILGVLQSMPEPDETLPDEIRYKYHLISKGDSVRCIHYPASEEDLMLAKRRIIFEEFYQLLLALKKRATDKGLNYFRIHGSPSLKRIIDIQPYNLTASQASAIWDIQDDFRKERVANRLIQGDVGCGKTIVALCAMVIMADNGFQSALMAPTEVLASQHFKEVCRNLEKIGKMEDFMPVLLTGSMKEKEKERARELLASGKSKIVVGTHALIQEKVEYRDLALVVIDEQHRFGVEQREALSNKGLRPVHTIIMTATPIPRTTANILFGGMDISVMNEKPANRLPVINHVMRGNDIGQAYSLIGRELQNGHQAYIICPMVDAEESEKKSVEKYGARIEATFPGIRYSTMYGAMDPVKKQQAMDEFASGTSSILISTTVVEVGVNVPNATVMLIENANMFGMLQLHQLRGRVGRGDAQSYCIFMAPDAPCEKLEVLGRTNDGFEVAEADYRIRKAGSLLGTQQSGDMGFKLADIIRDEDILKQAQEAVEAVTHTVKEGGAR